ncbi:MAG: DUF1835 domain-containing protein [Gemmatimonadaceae bacterium]
MCPHLAADERRPLDIEQLRTQAKELRRALVNGSLDAIRRYRAMHPKAKGLADGDLAPRLAKITEAQLVIAREAGAPSWPQLLTHVKRLAKAREEMQHGASALDADCRTMHIRCGSDIADGLGHAGLRGEFLMYSDPMCMGPVPIGPNLVETRAAFAARTFGMDEAELLAQLQHAEQRLADSVQAERVVLWFEHDSYDQLILARLLGYYQQRGRPRRLELVLIDHFPGVSHFIGLGELSDAALRMLWDDRREVSDATLQYGARVWQALRDPSPTTLWQTTNEPGAVPQMARAVRRHLQELPWKGDGLSLTQRLALELLQEEPQSARKLFGRLTSQREPLPFLGDSMFHAIVDELLRGKPSPIHREGPEGSDRTTQTLNLTDSGQQLLRGERDWLSCNPPERWVGGVRISAAHGAWRWDPVGERPRLDS